MKLVKSLLLGSAAGLAAVAGAQAADLPVRKAAPVEYVRVCSAYGVGFFYIPGTDTCLRVSGRARFEYNVASARQFSQSPTGFRSTGRINLDARTQTAYGTLRAFVRYEIARRTGQFFSGTAQRQGNAELPIGVDFFGQAQHQIVLDKAFIQFAGLTAGRATSFFDFYANDLGFFGIGGGSDRASTNLLAYTASFGSGWSATLSLEDPVERRYPIVTNLGGAALVNGATLFAAAEAAIQIFNPITGLPINSAFVGQRQRNAMPDIVAAVRVDQPWGSAQLSGIIHQIPVIGAAIPAGNLFAGATFTGFRPDTEYGYGVQAGVKINLPMIAPGDLLYLQAVYARGCIDCVVGGAWVLGGGTASQGGFPGTNGRFSFNTADGVFNPLLNEVSLSKEWGAVAAFLHYWTPQLRSGFQLAYSKVDFPSLGGFFVGGFTNPVFGPTGAITTTGVARDWTMINAAVNLIWSPVRDLDIGVEVSYDRIKLGGGSVSDLNKCAGLGVIPAGVIGPAAVACPFTTSKEDEWRARLRIQRDF
ncbi:MAG: porin [Microvirga sp.]